MYYFLLYKESRKTYITLYVFNAHTYLYLTISTIELENEGIMAL